MIKIGIILPLTGSAAVWGQNAKMGIDLAYKEIVENNLLKDKQIKLFFEDSKSETKDAIFALEKLISIEKVPIVIGDIASSSVLAMAPIAEKNKVVLLSPGASNPDISFAGDFIFRNWQSDALEGDIGASFVYNTLKKEIVGILFVNNGYGIGLKNSFTNKYTSLGGIIKVTEAFEQDATDMKTQLNKLKTLSIDIVYLPGYPKEMALVLKQAKELNYTPQFISTQSFDDPYVLEFAKDAAEGIIFSVPQPADTTNPIVNHFQKNYRMLFNKEPGVCSNTGYDALNIVVWAINNGAITGEDFKKQFYKLKDFNGAAGLTTFNENGDVIRPFIFKIVKNNTFQIYK